MATHSHNRLFSAEIQQMKLRGQAIGDGAPEHDLQREILGGEEAFEDIRPPDEGPEDPDKALPGGPRLDEENKISQDDIDALFD